MNRKRIISFLLAFIIVLTNFVIIPKNQQNIYAKSKKNQLNIVKELKNGIYKYDLDGDGKKEKIKIKINDYDEIVNGLASKVRVEINGKVFIEDTFSKEESESDCWLISVYLLDINRLDNKIEIAIRKNIENDITYQIDIYRYADGKLEKKIKTNKNPSIKGFYKKQDKNGTTLKVVSELYDTYLGQILVNKYFKENKNKLIEIKNTNIYEVDEGFKKIYIAYKAKFDLTGFKSLNKKAVKFKIKKGDEFSICKVKFIKNRIPYFYICTEDGRKGWIKNPNKFFYNFRYFDGIEYHDYDEGVIGWG